MDKCFLKYVALLVDGGVEGINGSAPICMPTSSSTATWSLWSLGLISALFLSLSRFLPACTICLDFLLQHSATLVLIYCFFSSADRSLKCLFGGLFCCICFSSVVWSPLHARCLDPLCLLFLAIFLARHFSFSVLDSATTGHIASPLTGVFFVGVRRVLDPWPSEFASIALFYMAWCQLWNLKLNLTLR